MAYYTRVLAEKESRIPVSTIREWLWQARLTDVEVVIEEGDEESWTQITLKRKSGAELTTIERNPV